MNPHPIGGFFGLDLPAGPSSYHATPFTFKSGRSAFRCILEHTSAKLVYVPHYTCDSLLEPLVEAGIAYEFYEVDEQLEPKVLPDLEPGALFVYINYFDLKRATVSRLSALYGAQLVVDCTQAFFMKGNGLSWFFNSARKFFGVPDGAYLYTPDGADLVPITLRNEDYLVMHLIDRFNGRVAEGYAMYQENERIMDTELKAMSLLSERLLSHIDYDAAMLRRRENYHTLHTVFGNHNLYDAVLHPFSVPMSYPLLAANIADKRVLAGLNLFIPTLWADVLNRVNEQDTWECRFTQSLLPLPIDHRYGEADMQRLSVNVLAAIG